MNRTTLRYRARLVPIVALVFLAGGCGLLDVSDPTAVEESDLEGLSGAMLLRGDALRSLAAAASHMAWYGGLLADEFLVDPLPTGTTSTEQALLIDQRQSERFEQEIGWAAGQIFGRPSEARRAASVAIPLLRDFGVSAHFAEALAARAYATVLMAEHFCPGFPVHDVIDYKPVYSGPLSTDEVFSRALEDLGTAAEHAADSARILSFVRVAEGRALLGQGKFAAAAAAVANVPSDYTYMGEFGAPCCDGSWNQLPETSFSPTPFGGRRTVADREGGNGLDFVSAVDPRVEVRQNGTLHDGVTPLHALVKYPTTVAPIVLASGIEARLIEAEAALHAGDPNWLSILNTLRRDRITPALPDLIDPVNADARADLLFRERAFWLFATGHRLGDLRRLVAHYGRDPESVFPSGVHHAGVQYGDGTSLPFAAELERPFSPTVTGCTSR